MCVHVYTCSWLLHHCRNVLVLFHLLLISQLLFCFHIFQDLVFRWNRTLELNFVRIGTTCTFVCFSLLHRCTLLLHFTSKRPRVNYKGDSGWPIRLFGRQINSNPTLRLCASVIPCEYSTAISRKQQLFTISLS